MKELQPNSLVRVYNTGLCEICVEVPNGAIYEFNASNDGVPFELEMPLSDIKTVNQRSNIFKDGYLTFDEDVREDVYNALFIKDWKNILTDEQIVDIVLHPTKDGLNQLLAVKTFSGFERVKGIFMNQYLIRSNDVPARVKDLFDKRQKEINDGKFVTSLRVENSDVHTDADEVVELKAQLEAMQKQMAELLNAKTTDKVVKKTTKK